MEPLSAILGFAGSAVGGLFNFLGVSRQAQAAEHASDNQRAVYSDYFNYLTDALFSQERLAEITGRFGSERGFWNQRTQRTRIFYNYKSVEGLRGTLIALGGLAIVGVAVWAAAKEGE